MEAVVPPLSGGYDQTSPEIGGGKGFMLFGVKVMEGSFRKSASMTNLAQYEQEQPHDSTNDVAAGYASDDIVHPSGRGHERKRGVPWTEEEHMLFLLGLQKVGKGDWRGISRNYVKTRTPTQVASHAQKYFLRRNNHGRRRRRSSLFDITTDTVLGSKIEEQKNQEKSSFHPPMDHQHLTKNNEKLIPMSSFLVPITRENSMENLTLGMQNSTNLIPPIPNLPPPPSSKMANLDLNNTIISKPDSLPLALKLSISSPPSPPSLLPRPPPEHNSSQVRHVPGFQTMQASFSSNSGDSMVSVS